jgi:hypothetical protein
LAINLSGAEATKLGGLSCLPFQEFFPKPRAPAIASPGRLIAIRDCLRIGH